MSSLVSETANQKGGNYSLLCPEPFSRTNTKREISTWRRKSLIIVSNDLWIGWMTFELKLGGPVSSGFSSFGPDDFEGWPRTCKSWPLFLNLTHESWTLIYDERLNRWESPFNYEGMGSMVFCRKSRIGSWRFELMKSLRKNEYEVSIEFPKEFFVTLQTLRYWFYWLDMSYITFILV